MTAPFTLHFAQHGGQHTMGSSSLLALKAEAVDMADKGWAHPERITDADGRVLRWNAFQINPEVDEWEDAPADRMEEDT